MYENNNGSYENNTTPVSVPVQTNDAAVQACVDAAFNKALAATIMCEFPIASIIAIVFGCSGLNLVETAKRLAAERGVKPSGKIIAATILGKIGKIAGIIMTAFWGIYIFAIILAVTATM